MQVACPSCSAEYPVNERRLPANGLKMRCPKCSARFHVHPDGRTEDAAASPALGKSFPKPAQPKPAKAPPARGDLELDLPAPKAAVPAVPKPSVPKPARDLDLDLPAPKAKKAPIAPPVQDLDLDLPAPKAKKAPIAPPVQDLDLDLPAPKAKRAPIAPPVQDLDLDLPAPKAKKAPIAPPVQDLDLDLPTPKPAKLPAGPTVGELDLDLPAPVAGGPRRPPPGRPRDISSARGAPDDSYSSARGGPRDGSARGTRDTAPARPAAHAPSPNGSHAPTEPRDLDLDLPAPKAAKPIAPAFSELDLDLPAPAAKKPIAPARPAKPALADDGRTPFDDLDLPAPRSSAQRVIAEADAAFGDLDLPMPKRTGGAASDFGELDLPVPKGASDRPAPMAFGELDLPAPRTSSDLPALKGDGLDGLDLLEPRDAPAGSAFGELDLPAPRADLPVAKNVAAGFGELDLPEPPAALPGFGELDLPETELPVARGAADLPVAKGELDLGPGGENAGRGQVGGTAFGELDLGDSGDDMEFADIPQKPRSEASLPPDAPPLARAVEVAQHKVAQHEASRRKEPPARSKSRAALVVGVLIALILGGGAALGLTRHGYFGVYFFDRFLPGAGDPAAVRAAIERAEEQARSDTWSGVRESLSTLAQARRVAGLNRPLLARSLVHESLYQLRFGADAGSATRASAIARRLDERGAAGPEMALGLAAHALARGEDARAHLQEAATHAPDDPYLDLLRGEAALARGALDEAEQAFARAVEHGAGARGLWGIARAKPGDDAAIDAVLAASPTHEDALAAKAEQRLDDGALDEALAIARQVVGRALREGVRLRAAPRTRARGWTVIGRIHESRGVSTAALAAYDRALAAHDAHVSALLGAGRVLLGDRPADAIARFDSVLQAEGAGAELLANGRTAAQEAQLGSARGNLALDRAREAVTTLEQLAAERPEDAEVLLWLGHAEGQLDPPNHAAAEQHYRASIAAAPERFAGYLGLAELFFETQRGEDAGVVLEQAADRVPESAQMRLQLGQFELRRNRLPEAIAELSRALELDPDLPAAHFALGVAYRRSGRLDEADQTFAHLARIDPGHPRLALERGLLFEARGESIRAVEAYRAALEENEGDMDLMLRLGAAQVAAGQIDEAEETLEAVQDARPSSPEAAHFVGRVAFARGSFAEALTQFRRAVRIDPTRGEFHLYAAWAALENNQLGEALERAEAAIERDPSLGEAYWIRAVVRLRSGNPAGALPDLTRALELRPSFHRVHATIGDAQDQLGHLDQAVAAYERAVAAADDQGEWWWRLGRLRMDAGDRRGASEALARATLLGDAATPLPGWLAAAHRLYGNALRAEGRRADAVSHYQRYLTLAPPGDIDRPEVQRILRDMGASPN